MSKTPQIYRDDHPYQISCEKYGGIRAMMDELGDEFYRLRNYCVDCDSYEVELRNYSAMWHDGDIHCIKCDALIRYWDAG